MKINIVSLEECIDKLIDNRGVTPHKRNTEWQENGIPVLSANNVKTNGLQKLNEIRFIDESIYNSWMKYPLEKGDLLLTSEAPAGEVMYWDSDEKVIVGQRLYGIKVKSEIDSKYLKYYLQSDIGQREIKKFSTGSTVFGISEKTFKHIKIILPPKDIQQKIGSILYNIDKKISNNLKENEIIDDFMHKVFKRWFWEFNFLENGKPYKASGGKMIYNENLKKEIPINWEVVDFSKIGKFEKGKIPKEILKSNEDNLLHKYITIDVANDKNIQYCSNEKMVMCNGETIMVMDGAASGEVYIGNYGVLGSTFSKIISLKNDCSNTFIYELLKNNEIIIKKANTGSTVPHANKVYIENMKFPLPKNLKEASEYFDKLEKMIIKNRNENLELTNLREKLLPMLINGQINVDDVKI